MIQMTMFIGIVLNAAHVERLAHRYRPIVLAGEIWIRLKEQSGQRTIKIGNNNFSTTDGIQLDKVVLIRLG